MCGIIPHYNYITVLTGGKGGQMTDECEAYPSPLAARQFQFERGGVVSIAKYKQCTRDTMSTLKKVFCLNRDTVVEHVSGGA